MRVQWPELKHKWAILIAEHNFLGKAPQFRDDNYVDSRNYKQGQVREKKQRTVKPSCGTMSHMESPIIIKITTSHRVMPPDLGILGSLSCKDCSHHLFLFLIIFNSKKALPKLVFDFWLCPYLSFAIKIKIKWPTECTMINSKSYLSPWHYQKNSTIWDTWNPINQDDHFLY